MVENFQNIGYIKVVERKRIKKILEELKLNVSGLVDSDKAIEIGRILGAQYLVFGSILGYKKDLIATARIINVETTETIIATNVKGKMKNYFTLFEELSKDLINEFQRRISNY